MDELTLMKNEEGKKHWVITHQDMNIRESGRYFSPGNTKAIKHSEGYKKAIEYWSKSNYQIRYSGGMAPDCYHIFAKREGVFSSISAMPHVPPKLRFLYEVAPISFLVEKAGGKSSDGYKSIMDVQVTGFVQKGDIIVGSEHEVNRVERYLQAEKAQS